jgi:hypothetical protein
LNAFAALPSAKRFQARHEIIDAVKNGRIERERFLPLEDVTMHLLMEIKGFMDFLYAKEHLTNIGLPQTHSS